MTYEIYPPTLAAAICTQALRTGRCGELLNELSAGGAATLDPSIVNGDWIEQLQHSADGPDGLTDVAEEGRVGRSPSASYESRATDRRYNESET
jgi:hypothetical protein